VVKVFDCLGALFAGFMLPIILVVGGLIACMFWYISVPLLILFAIAKFYKSKSSNAAL
jgi:lipoprotein